MKTPTNSFRSIRRLLPFFKRAGIILAVGSLASCGTSSIGSPDSTAGFQPNHWHKVRSNPPTYFPKGVSAQHSTGAEDGMWVISGDSAGSRYFVPVRGVDAQGLVAEAMTTMTPERREYVRKGDGGGAGDVGKVVREIVGGGLLGIGSLVMEVDQQNKRRGYEPKGEGMRR